MKKTLALLTMLLAFLPSVLTAQAKPTVKSEVILVYADDDLELSVVDASGNPLVAKEGMSIPIGAVITTKNTTAELQLRPNKSIIKLANKTTFQVKALKDDTAAGSNDFLLAAGKIRTVAAKLTGAKAAPGYNIATATANCGVRGTDFAMKYDPVAKLDWVCVQEGQVDFTNVTSGVTVPVATGQFANTFDAVFSAGAVDSARLAELFSDVDFVKLSPTDVPGKEIAPVAQQKTAETTTADKAPAQAQAASDDPVMEMLKKFFGMEVGSVTIRGTTYSKAVLSPVFAFDSFKLGLYLPIIYTSDLFSPQDWYHPEGNDEWSFGGDKSGVWDKTADIANDLALKIKFLEIGKQGVDPFYLKVGNLKSMSLGHGSIVRNFANDQDFPSVRKVGLNAGVKVGQLTVEGLADDIAKASVVGGRVAFDLAADQVTLGIQAAADLQLANKQDMAQDPEFYGYDANYLGHPILLVGGLDLQLFKINSGAAFRTTAFADLNTLAVYFQNDPSSAWGSSAKQGLNISPLWHDGELGSFGGETGLYGNVSVVDYRVSFQVERGLYTNGVFQGNYYRTRNAELKSTVGYILGSKSTRESTDKILTMGIYGDFGFDVGIVSLGGAYRWPFALNGASLQASDADYLKIKIDIPKDKIPFVALSGGVSYERTGFVPSLRDHVNLFDANTVLKGEVVYGLTKGLDLVLGVATSALRDAQGNVVYESASKPKVGPTVSIDTKISL